MKYFKVCLYSNDLLSLKEKRKIINAMYGERATYSDKKRNIGFMAKFNNAIGFSDVEIHEDNYNRFGRLQKVKNPEEYISPEMLLFHNLRTPVESFTILEFYIPDMEYKHTYEKYSYKTKMIALKWKKFLDKVFPDLEASFEVVKEKPELSTKEFAFQFFYSNLEEFPVTIEFGTNEKLTKKDIKYMLPKLQTLTNDKITIGQFECETCQERGFKYHTEIVYLTWYGKPMDDDETVFYKRDIFMPEGNEIVFSKKDIFIPREGEK
jgi:hypothetical protein